MRWLSIALWLLSCGFAAAQTISNDPDGFRGWQWGKSIVECEDELVPLAGQTSDYLKSSAAFRRKGDQLSIGEAQLADVIYGFYKGQFASVMIKTDGVKIA